MTQGIDRVYRQCDPAKPLEPNDPRYISCAGLRGTGDLVGRVANAIRRSDDPMHLLFTGHRGGGQIYRASSAPGKTRPSRVS